MEAVAHGRHMHPPRRIHHPGNKEERHGREAGAPQRGGRQVSMGSGKRGEVGRAVGHKSLVNGKQNIGGVKKAA
jgi:hypothetical protein